MTIGPILIIPLVMGAGVYLGGWPVGAVISVVTAIGAWANKALGKRG